MTIHEQFGQQTGIITAAAAAIAAQRARKATHNIMVYTNTT